MGTTVSPNGLTVLSNPQDALVDIVFVHGLQGHPRKTWTSSPNSPPHSKNNLLRPSEESKRTRSRDSSSFRLFSTRKQSRSNIETENLSKVEDRNKEAEVKDIFWPEDLLKADFPSARIMTFGYNTNIQQAYHAVNQGNIFSHARNLLYELAAQRRQAPNRHLICIAHSLGGILVKEVLRRSQADPDDKIKKIYESTTGVFFFGTPHRGSRDWVSFGEGLAAVASRLLGIDVNSQVIHALLPTGPELEICRESFAVQWGERRDSLTVRTFQESKGVVGVRWGGFNQLIVPEDSSSLDHPDQRARTIDADHFTMVKFSGKNDKCYEMVKIDIEELMVRAEEAATQSRVLNQSKEKPEERPSQEARECLQALRTSDYEQFKDRNPQRLERTCEWFLQHEFFNNWRQTDSSSLLWVSADPGCGKSVLSKSLVDEDLKSTDSRVTCYFFFKDDNEKQRSITSALCALLHQFFSQKPSLIHHALSEHRVEGGHLPKSFHKLRSILTNAVVDPKAGEVICILDALDECEESGRYDIISFLNTFYGSGNKASRLKFLVTSRPYLDIETRFKELTYNIPTIRLRGERESEAISREINIVIRWKVGKLGLELDLDKSEQSTLERELLSTTHRTYLWLKLIFEVIRGEIDPTSKKLKQIISTLPGTVYQAYEAILSKIKDKMQAQKLLHIIVAATRPLTLKEMRLVLAIDDHHRSYEDLDLQSEARFESFVRNICGLFVNVIDKKIYLIHQTAKEFLVAKNQGLVGRWKHSLDPVESHILMARKCITYIMFTCFDDGITGKDSLIDEVVINYTSATDAHGYLDYAARFWATHYREAQNKATQDTLQSVLKVCDIQSRRFQIWFSIYWNMAHQLKPNPRFTSTMMVGSCFGHEAVVKLLLATGKTNVDSKDRSGRTSLSWAAENGHEAVIKLLLATGKADVNSKDRYGQTPLRWAAWNGHEAVAKVLLATCKADVDSKDRSGRTPLSWAAEKGHEAVVKLLFATGKADVDLKDRPGRTPLSWATENGHEAVIKLLLATGKVDVNSTDKRSGRTPLSWAAEKGHEAVIKVLLATGKADVDLKDERYNQTPLSWAAEKGHEVVVKLLLATGKADVDSKDRSGRTPLWWAAGNGHEAVVKLLLATGKADVDSKDGSGRKPLWRAAEKGHENVVKLLLATGKTDVDSKDKEYGRTPLSWAAENGHEAVVKLLLAMGKTDVNLKDKSGQTPLSWAAGNGHEAVIKLLLLATGKINVDSKDKSGRTPLSWATENGHEAVVKLLLATGKINVDSKDKKYDRTPLSWAAENGHEAVIKLLLATGKVDVDSEDKDCETPSGWAIKNGHKSVFKLLQSSNFLQRSSKFS